MFLGMSCLSILGRYIRTPDSVQCLNFKIAGMEINANLTNNVEKMENAKFCTICVLGPGVLGMYVYLAKSGDLRGGSKKFTSGLTGGSEWGVRGGSKV